MTLKQVNMLKWAYVMLIMAIVSGVFWFGKFVSAVSGLAQAVFVVSMLLFTAAVFGHLLKATAHPSDAPIDSLQ